MAPSQRGHRPRVLHVASTAAQRSQALDQAVTEAGVVCDRSDNVYDALAQLLRPDRGDSPLAVVVCVDDLDEAELEFVALVREHRPAVPVYVYSYADDRPRVEQVAAEFGACTTGPSQIGRQLAERVPEPVPTAATPTPEPAGPAPSEPADRRPPARRPPQPISRERPADSPDALLTPEELAALLGQDGSQTDTRSQHE
jgi:hypothetical protein